MFDDIVICEMFHHDPQGDECCNPDQIAIGFTKNQSIMISLVFKSAEDRKAIPLKPIKNSELQIFAEVLNNTKTDLKEKYDVQEAVKITINRKNEEYQMIIGSNGLNFPYFTNLPAINNTTDFADSIYLNFPHTVEGFTFQSQTIKVF